MSVVPELQVAMPLIDSGYIAVDLFFVLSGFILAYQYGTRVTTLQSYGRFLLNRFARIYPAHVTMLLVFVILVVGGGAAGFAVRNPEQYTVGGALADLFLVRAWIGDSIGWNAPSWSVSAEWLAYIAFPVLLAVVAAADRRRAGVWALGLALVAFGGLSAHFLPSLNGMAIPAVRVIVGFALGLIVFRITRDLRASRTAGWASVIALVFLIVGTAAADSEVFRAFFGPLVAACVVGLLYLGRGPGIRWLTVRPLIYGGTISYSLYMVHAAMLIVLARLVPEVPVGTQPLAVRAALVVAGLTAIVAAAAALYHFVENPARRRMLSLSTRRTG